MPGPLRARAVLAQRAIQQPRDTDGTEEHDADAAPYQEGDRPLQMLEGVFHALDPCPEDLVPQHAADDAP